MGKLKVPCNRQPNKTFHFAPSGEQYVKHLIHSYDEHGQVIVVEDKTEDRVAEIQRHRDECDLRLVLARCLQTGDMTPLGIGKEAVYGDQRIYDQFDADHLANLGEMISSTDGDMDSFVSEFNAKYGTHFSALEIQELGQYLAAHPETAANNENEGE